MTTSSLTKRIFLSLDDRIDSELAAAEILKPSSEPGLRYLYSVSIPGSAWDIAHPCGLARTLIKKTRGRKAYEARGSDDERIDTEGCLGEYLAATLLGRAGAICAPLVAYKPDSSGVDITLEGHGIDVKSVTQARYGVNINQRAHLNKAPAFYLVVRFARGDVADFFLVAAAEVSNWRLNTNNRGVALDPGRYYYSATLPRLEALQEEAEA